jgi:DNA-binding transcriptional MerR regulator
MATAATRATAVPDKPFYRIGEVSKLTATKQFVLRYWETEFPTLQPVKSPKGHRLYRREDIELVFQIKQLLYEQGFTIAGARRHLSEEQDGGNGNGQSHESAAPSRPVSRAEYASAPIRSESRAESLSHSQRKLLLNLHEELLAILTLLEPR